MSIFSDLLGGGFKGIAEGVGGIVDKFVTTDAERDRAKLELERLINARQQEVEKTLQREMQAKERILVAELQQDDGYTKRARPSVVYTGLVIAVGSAVAKLLGSGVDVSQLVPSEFWLAWGGITGTWVVGRTMEKRGMKNKFTRISTGE